MNMQKSLAVSTSLAAVLWAAPLTAAPRIAVVNIPQVSEQYRKTADLEQRFDATRTRLKQERDAMQDRLERMRRSLVEELKPGTPEFGERRKKIAMLEAEIQWFVESEGQRIERGLARSLRTIYADVQEVVVQLARDEGYDVVLASDELPPDTPENPNQVKQQILMQKVLYWSPQVDITDKVVARLNAQYKGLDDQGGGEGNPNRFAPDDAGIPSGAGRPGPR